MFLFVSNKNILCYVFYISDGQLNPIVWKQIMWNLLNFHSNSTVCHPSTPERDDPNEFHSVEFIRRFSIVELNDFQFHINYTPIPQLVSCLCKSNVELETSTR